MQRFLIFSIVLCIGTGSAGIVAAQDIPQAFSIKIPEGASPTVDGDLNDWAWFPEVAVVTPEQMTSQHDVDVVYNPEDFDLRLMLAYSEETNLFYLGVEIFDDILNRIPSADKRFDWGWDDMEIYTDPDNSGGQYQWSAAPRETWGQTAQQWWYMIGPSNEPYGGVLNIGGASWMDDPPYHNQALTVTEVTGGTRLTWEVSMVLWDLLSPEGPGQSRAHNLTEGDVLGMSFVYADFDEDGAYQGYWKLHRLTKAHENADVFADIVLIGPPGTTSAESGTWGRIKSTFLR